MAIDPVNPLVDWLVSSTLDAGIRLARGPAGERALRTATKRAIDNLVQEVDPEFRETLTASLAICFSSKIRVQLRPSENTGAWLRRAIAQQLDVLDQVETSPGNAFWDDAPFGREWLYNQVAAGIVTALRQMISKNETASLVHGIEIGEVLDRLDSLDLRITQSALTRSAEATRILRRDISSFTGRTSEMGFLIGLIDRAKSTGAVVSISAIDGMAGIGKTTLALHAAHELSHRFPDGQIFLELHGHTPGQLPVEPGDALTSLLLIMGVPAQQIPEDVQGRSQLWRHNVSGKKIIIVLDDVADYEQVRWLLPGAPETLVLITSRNRLSALEGAATITLDTLSPDDATEMLRRVADRRDSMALPSPVMKSSACAGIFPWQLVSLAASWQVIALRQWQNLRKNSPPPGIV